MSTRPAEPVASAAAIVKPNAIRNAGRLMYVGAVVELIRLNLRTLPFIDGLRHNLRSTNDGFTEGELGALVFLGILSWILVQVILVGAWVWMAWANGQGKGWARVTATGLFVLSVLGTARGLLASSPGALEVSRLLVVVLGGVIVYLLWAGDGSAQYYTMMERSDRTPQTDGSDAQI